MSTPGETAALYTALEHAIGPEPAGTLMEQLPDRTRFATKDDLSEMHDSIDRRLDAVNVELRDLGSSMHGYVRTFIITQVTSIFGAVGLFFGISQLT